MKRRRVRVLVVDDSALVRQVLTTGLESDPDIEVVGTAADPYEARNILVRERPDVVTLDIEMPRMDGVTFLRKFMPVIPTPTIVVGNLTSSESRSAVAALEAGAIEVIQKPSLADGGAELAAQLIERVKAAAHVAPSTLSTGCKAASPSLWKRNASSRLVVIGASTGGVRALPALLRSVSPQCPPVLIAQHMPHGYTRSLAECMDTQLAIRVVEAENGMSLRPGTAFIAPANDLHTVVERVGAGYRLAFRGGDKLCSQRPAVDALFQSVANRVTIRTIGILLTGMGSDGARGLLAIRNAGGRTICEDESTAVVFGMPAVAWRLGAAEKKEPLDRIATTVDHWLETRRRRGAARR